MKSVQNLKNTDSEFLCYWSLTEAKVNLAVMLKSDLQIEHLAPRNAVCDSLNRL